MKALWMFLKVVLVLIVAAIGAMFAMENGQQVSVNLLLGQSVTLSLGFWLLLFLSVGCFLGLLSSALILSSYRRKLAKANRAQSDKQMTTPATT